MKKQQLGWLLTATVALAGTAAIPATAEQIQLPLGQQGEASVERPPHGVNKAQVEAVYGAPLSKHGPTGDPAIYYWEYPDYTVYFEGNTVLHSVLKHKS